MLISFQSSLLTPLTMAASSAMTLDTFKDGLLSIQAVTDRLQPTPLEPFPQVKARLNDLLRQAGSSETIRSACPDYAFSQPPSVHSHSDIHSWVSRLLSALEGHSMPPSQHDATLAHYMSELSPEAADLVSRSTRRVSDLPGADNKKKK